MPARRMSCRAATSGREAVARDDAGELRPRVRLQAGTGLLEPVTADISHGDGSSAATAPLAHLHHERANNS